MSKKCVHNNKHSYNYNYYNYTTRHLQLQYSKLHPAAAYNYNYLYHYSTLPLHYNYNTLHYHYAYTTLQVQLQLQLQLHYTTLLHPAVVGEVTNRSKSTTRTTFRSISSLCHKWITTTHLSYSFLSFETSATTLCGTTGNVLYYRYPLVIKHGNWKSSIMMLKLENHLLMVDYYKWSSHHKKPAGSFLAILHLQEGSLPKPRCHI